MSGTLDEVASAYLASPEYRELAPETRTNYKLHLDDLRSRVGNFPISKIGRAPIKRRRDALSDTPGKANRFIGVCRLLFEWARSEGRWAIGENPASGIRRLKTGPGWRRWKPEEISAFKQKADPAMRLALVLGLCTGLRRSDAIRLRKSAYQRGIIEIETAKRGVPLRVPAHRDLRIELEAAEPTAAITVLANPDGRPWEGSAFSKAFSAEVARIGFPADCHFHGLRKTAGCYLAESGCTENEIMSVLACSAENAAAYCREANRLTLATAAVAKLERHRNDD